MTLQDYTSKTEEPENDLTYTETNNSRKMNIKKEREFVSNVNTIAGEELTILFLETDVLLLTDSCENPVSMFMKFCGISPLQFYELLGYAWQRGLTITRKKGTALFETINRYMLPLRKIFSCN